MKSLIQILSVLMLLAALGCKSGSSENLSPEMVSADMASRELPPPPPVMSEKSEAGDESSSPVTNPVMQISKRIIRDGNMEIRVNDPAVAKKAVDTLIKAFNAYYSNESFNNTDYSHGFTLVIRIPSDRFDPFVHAIEKGPGEVVFKNITSRDVTEEFIDLTTRLTNKRNYINRYGELLKQAKTVKDILEIEEKTRIIEEEVESVEGRLTYLNNQVDFSTLNLQITKKNDYRLYTGNKGRFIDRLKLSIVKGWFGFVSFCLFLIRIWPFWLILGVVTFFVKKYWKKKK